ncbi:MAG: ORF6N domain-containing protein [Opitutaceae bacterium]
MPDVELVPLEPIQSCILVLRGVRVILDADLARLYGVPTKRLNEQVKRNARKFPEDFVFRLNREEARGLAPLRSQNATLMQGENLRSQFATSSQGEHGGRRSLPYAFTEHGAIQAANVLNSAAAAEMSVHVVRAFVRLRQLVVNHKAIAAKLAEIEARGGAHDEQIAAVIEALRRLTAPDGPRHQRKIGFGTPTAGRGVTKRSAR